MQTAALLPGRHQGTRLREDPGKSGMMASRDRIVSQQWFGNSLAIHENLSILFIKPLPNPQTGIIA
jgi:hypothetical protein